MIISRLDENTYEILKIRYQDSIQESVMSDEFKEHYEINLRFNENNSEVNYDYMQDLFEKFKLDKTTENKEKLIKSLAILGMQDQEIAIDIINSNDISGYGDLISEINKVKAIRLDKKIKDYAELFGFSFDKLKGLYIDAKSEDELNKGNRFVDLISLADGAKVQEYYNLPFWRAKSKLYDDTRDFILNKNLK